MGQATAALEHTMLVVSVWSPYVGRVNCSDLAVCRWLPPLSTVVKNCLTQLKSIFRYEGHS